MRKIINNILFNESIWLVLFDIKNAYRNIPTEELIVMIDNELEGFVQWFKVGIID